MQVSCELVIVNCCECGTPFGLERGLQKRLVERGGSFYCPNGHSQHYCEPMIEKLRKELAARLDAEFERDQAVAELAQTDQKLATAKTKNRKLKERIGRGACPCCGETFADLERHMKHKHPGYGERKAKQTQRL